MPDAHAGPDADEPARPSAAPTAADRAARVGVTVLFTVNGAMIANWVPRIPEVKAALGLGEAALGAALLGVGLGGLLGSLAAGPFVARLGSRTASVAAALVLGAALVAPGLAAGWPSLVLALTAIGAADGLMDVSMNAHAVVVQRGYPRPILNAFHAWWGIGAAAGALVGSVAVGAGVPIAVHLATAGVVLALVCVASRRLLLPTATDRRESPDSPTFVRPGPAVLALGGLALVSAFLEDLPASWSAVYLREGLSVPPGLAGAGYAAATAFLTVGRLLADRLQARIGVIALARGGLVVAVVGLGVGMGIAAPWAATAGFALLGLGVAPLFPAVFGAAGALPGYPPGAAISMASLVARFGFLLGPVLVGAAADVTALGTALQLAALVGIAGLVLTRWLAPAARPDRDAQGRPGAPP